MEIINNGKTRLEEIVKFNKKVKDGSVEKIKKFSTSSQALFLSKPLARLYMNIKGAFAGADYAEIHAEGYSFPTIIGDHSYSGVFYRNIKK